MGERILFANVSYSGHRFGDYFAAQRETCAPGWFIYGRNSEKYGMHPDGRGIYVMLVAQPDVPPRRRPNYNGTARRGWRTKREAERVAAYLAANPDLTHALPSMSATRLALEIPGDFAA
jgi:hypothetical protein